MNWQHGVLLGTALASAVIAWATVFFLLPRVALSVFRYRVWEIRDALVDDMLDGNIRRSTTADRVQDLIETGIIRAQEMTLVDLLVWRWSRGPDLPTSPIVEELAAMPGKDGELLREHFYCFLEATQKHLLHGTPTGWLMRASLSVLYRIHAARHQRPNRRATAAAIVQRNLLSELEASSSSVDRRLLVSV